MAIQQAGFGKKAVSDGYKSGGQRPLRHTRARDRCTGAREWSGHHHYDHHLPDRG